MNFQQRLLPIQKARKNLLRQTPAVKKLKLQSLFQLPSTCYSTLSTSSCHDCEINLGLCTIDHCAEQNTVPPNIESSLNSSRDHIFFEGKITYRKRKEPEDQPPTVMSMTKYWKWVLQKENKKKKGKKSENWKCCYCHILYLNEKKKKGDSSWIECHNCDRKMHIKCIPKTCLTAINFNITDIEDDVDFTSEACDGDE